MTDSSELVAVELTERERKFIQHALYQWQFSATSQPFPFRALGLSSTWDEFDELTGRLSYAIIGSEALTDLDWARVLYLVESSWASDLVGAGLDFATVTGFSDTEAVGLVARSAAQDWRHQRCQIVISERWSDPHRRGNRGTKALARTVTSRAGGTAVSPRVVTRQQRCKRLYPLR